MVKCLFCKYQVGASPYTIMITQHTQVLSKAPICNRCAEQLLKKWSDLRATS